MSNEKTVNLLVVVSLHDFNWSEAFKDEKIDGKPIKVLQANWNELLNVSYQEEKSGQVFVSIKEIKENKVTQAAIDSYQVHFVLFRTVCHHRYNQDARYIFKFF